MESKGEEYETRMTYADLLNDIVQELHAVQQYTDQYLIHNEQIKQIYRQQNCVVGMWTKTPYLF